MNYNFQALPLSPQASIGVQFNSEVDPGIDSAIHLSPSIPGEWSRYGDQRFVAFNHQQPFAFATTYTLRIDDSAMDRNGKRLPEPFTTSFAVQPFEILHSNPQDHSLEVSPSRSIYVQTNGLLDSLSLRQAFSMEPVVSGDIRSNWTVFEFIPNDDLQPSTLYTVTISTALRAWDGTRLAAPHVFSFTTDQFRIVRTMPFDGLDYVALDDSVVVSCSSRIDPASVAPAFSISPDIPGTLLVPSVTGSFSFTPRLPFAPVTTYTVTISTALHSRSGSPLPAPFTFSFTTAER